MTDREVQRRWAKGHLVVGMLLLLPLAINCALLQSDITSDDYRITMQLILIFIIVVMHVGVFLARAPMIIPLTTLSINVGVYVWLFYRIAW